MRNFIVVAVVVLSAILGANQALAFERGGFAESANAVTPLLNGQFDVVNQNHTTQLSRFL